MAAGTSFFSGSGIYRSSARQDSSRRRPPPDGAALPGGRKARAVASTVTTEPSKDSSTSSRPGYGQLLRTRGAWTFLLPGLAARQPFAMLTISIVLLVQHTTGSYGAAGAAAAVTGVSMALFAPYSGRLADRYGQRAVLLPGVLVHTAVRPDPDGARPVPRTPVGAVRGGRADRCLGAAGRAHGAGPLGREAPGLAPDDDRGGLRVGHRRADLRRRPAAGHRPVHRRRPGRGPGHGGRAHPARRSAVRRAEEHPAARSPSPGTRAWSTPPRCASPACAC